VLINESNESQLTNEDTIAPIVGTLSVIFSTKIFHFQPQWFRSNMILIKIKPIP